MEKQELQKSDYRIRKLIGVLGLLLPFMLLIAQGELLSSISHYYYQTLSSLLFIIILSAFGLFLISYKGYKIDPETEKISDDFITNIGGLAALIVVFIPTGCLGSGSDIIAAICDSGNFPLFGHSDKLKGTIHLASAGVFIFSMGWMSKYKFTRSSNDVNNRIYRICGNIIWGSIGLLIILIILEKLSVSFWLDKYYVVILETTAVVPFGISWLIKGKTIEDVKAIKDRFI
jgi:hypothetical protein